MTSRYAKALVALIPFAVGGLMVLSDALGDGHVTTQEWVLVAVALLTAGAVFQVPNRPPAGHPADPGMSEQDPLRDHGAVDVVTVLLVLVLVVFLIWLVGQV